MTQQTSNNRKSVLLLAAGVIATMGWAATAQAGVVLSPTGIVNNTFGQNPFGGYPDTNMINQSNVTPFTSGVTDFNSYVAGGPTAGCNNCAGQYFGQSAPGMIDFDLGNTYAIDALGLFNGSYRGITSVDIYTSAVSNFAVDTFVGSFQPTVIGDGFQDVGIQVFNLLPSAGEYVRLAINSFANLDGCNCLGVSEVTFNVGAPGNTSVPEPASIALFGAGLAGLGVLRRRRKSRKAAEAAA